jgi:hypothetical protein
MPRPPPATIPTLPLRPFIAYSPIPFCKCGIFIRELYANKDINVKSSAQHIIASLHSFRNSMRAHSGAPGGGTAQLFDLHGSAAGINARFMRHSVSQKSHD